MPALKITIPQELKRYVDACVAKGNHGDVNEFIISLVRERKQQAEQELLRLVREAEASGPATPMTRKDWQEIRRRALARIASEKRTHANRRQKARSGR
jgi:Arc/MetJ-type ribon-helix-helix transcriptional regulator